MAGKSKIKTIKKRRVCRFLKCEQILSIYNPEPYCHVHRQFAMAETSSVRQR